MSPIVKTILLSFLVILIVLFSAIAILFNVRGWPSSGMVTMFIIGINVFLGLITLAISLIKTKKKTPVQPAPVQKS